jgi:hypothetical protein
MQQIGYRILSIIIIVRLGARVKKNCGFVRFALVELGGHGRVTCWARVIHVNGLVVTFQIEAHDGIEPIARGIHKRRVIDVDRFARRLERKRENAGRALIR